MQDKELMRLALGLARRGEGKVSPNPMVGALIVKDGKIVCTGYHHRFGSPHAEINVLKKAGEKAKGGTLFVNLEPCCFFGKTPPCTEAIIEAGIKKVVCSIIDPNPEVSGKGIKGLRDSGIKVETGLLAEEARRLNEAYLKHTTTGKPFVIMKVAQTLDGKIATLKGGSKWITSRTSREFVHKLRGKVDAVLVGSGTIKKDNPELTTHNVKRENPRRIILTSSGNLPPGSRVFKNNKDNKTIVVTPKSTARLKRYGTKIWVVKKDSGGKINPKKFLKKAGQEGIATVLVEGGKRVFTSFMKERLVDKVYYFISPRILGKGKETFGDLGIKMIKDLLNLKEVELRRFDRDLLLIGYPDRGK